MYKDIILTKGFYMSIYPEIIFEQIEIGPMENFIYFIGELSTKKVAVIDPAWDINFIKQHAAGKGFTITHLLLTHGHFDHINAIDGFQQGRLWKGIDSLRGFW